MRIFNPGDKKTALCHRDGRVSVTFNYRDVPFSDGMGVARNVLAGVCDTCGDAILFPAQSTPTIAAERRRLEQAQDANTKWNVPLHQARTKRALDPDDGMRSGLVDELVNLLKAGLPAASIAVDPPSNPSGEWFIDVALGQFQAQISWHAQRGFGLFTAPQGYGDRPNEVFVSPRRVAARIVELPKQTPHSRSASPGQLLSSHALRE
jgi:hypothetical protein